jgi:N utilization substance protein A
MLAITQLAAEKNLPREVVLGVVESALVSAFRKNSFNATQDISVKVNPNTGQVTVYAGKTVVEKVTDPQREISLKDAKKINEYAQLDDEIQVEDTPGDAGRIAAQTAKQVVLQRLREAERELVFEEFADRESELVTGIVQRVEPRQTVLDLGRTEGVLPASEQVKSEHYRVGQRMKAYIIEVHRTGRGPQVIVSRTHRNLLKRLLELEVPEINTGVIELKAVAREAGHRSKIAVAARQQGIDAIGSCVGLRGIRIQNIVNELNGEKIDVIEWHADPATFIASALSPAPVISVSVNEEDKAATVVVPDKQLSLAIGKEGQNARLAARLTGWRIDIKSSSTAEAEETAVVEEAVAPEPLPIEEAATEVVEEAAEIQEPVKVEEPVAEVPPEEAVLLSPEELVPEIEQEEEEYAAEEELPAVEIPEEEPTTVIRFAEDILPDRAPKGGKKAKKVKDKVTAKVKDEEKAKGAIKPKKARSEKIDIEEEVFEDLEVPVEEVRQEEEEVLAVSPSEELELPAEEEKPAKKKKKSKAKVKDEEKAKGTTKPKKARTPKIDLEDEVLEGLEIPVEQIEREEEEELPAEEEKPAKKKKSKAKVDDDEGEVPPPPKPKKVKRTAPKVQVDEEELEEV